MHIQPNSHKISKKFAPEEFFQLSEEQDQITLINLPCSSFSSEQINGRVLDLEKLEARGFIYLGEKNWLLSYLSRDSNAAFNTYPEWVKHNFNAYLNITFTKTLQHPCNNEKTTIWKAELTISELALNYQSLQHPNFRPLDDLDIFIAGDMNGPDNSLLAQAFACLHQLEHSLTTFPFTNKWPHPIHITGVNVIHPKNPQQWELNVMSDYGSEWDISFFGAKALV